MTDVFAFKNQIWLDLNLDFQLSSPNQQILLTGRNMFIFSCCILNGLRTLYRLKKLNRMIFKAYLMFLTQHYRSLREDLVLKHMFNPEIYFMWLYHKRSIWLSFLILHCIRIGPIVVTFECHLKERTWNIFQKYTMHIFLFWNYWVDGSAGGPPAHKRSRYMKTIFCPNLRFKPIM